MSTYFYYYLEQKIGDDWVRLLPIEHEENDEIIFWHTRSYGEDFINEYEIQQIDFSDYCKKMKLKYQEAYEKSKNINNFWDCGYPIFYLLDLNKMIEDYNDNIHERAGIISHNDYLKLKRDIDYEPEIISPHDFNKLSSKIKDNYIYYAWDSHWSEYGHIYDIIPKVYEILEFNTINIEDVRLIYKRC